MPDEAGTRVRDEEQIRLLVMFHWVLAALQALMGLMSILYIGLGVAMMRGFSPFPSMKADGRQPDLEVFGTFAIVVGSVYVVLGPALATLTLMAGLRLRAYRARRFCMVVAGLNCLVFPLGTALGVFTLVVLARDTVKDLFDGTPPAAARTEASAGVT